MSTDVDETPLNNLKMISKFPKLVNLRFCFSGYERVSLFKENNLNRNPITLETMQVLCEILPTFKYLKRINIELRK